MATHLTRTCDATAGSGYSQKWTWSGWVKRAKLGAEQGIMGNQRNDNNTNSRFKLYFRSTDKLGWECKDSGGSDDSSFETNALFRDTNAWYHITFIYDTDNSTATERIKCYVNGLDVRTAYGGFSSDNQASSGFGTLWSSSVYNYLGTAGNNSGIDMQFYGCMSHCHLTYDQRYEASTFGETDSTTGQWKIKTSPSVTYGTQGYFLLKDNASVTDQSGEGNNYTATGTLTKTEDSPSNVFATMNPLDNQNQGSTFTMGNTKLEWNTNNKNNFATFAINKGKFYWEMKYANITGGANAMVGMSLADTRQGDDYPGHDATAWSYYSANGSKYNNGGSSYGNSWTTNDIIGVAFDADTRTLWFSKNGTWQNSATISEIAAGTTTNSAWTGIGSAGDWFIPCMSGYDGNKAEFNFGNGYFSTTAISSAGTNASGIGIFEYDVPTNFTALSLKGMNS